MPRSAAETTTSMQCNPPNDSPPQIGQQCHVIPPQRTQGALFNATQRYVTINQSCAWRPKTSMQCVSLACRRSGCSLLAVYAARGRPGQHRRQHGQACDEHPPRRGCQLLVAPLRRRRRRRQRRGARCVPHSRHKRAPRRAAAAASRQQPNSCARRGAAGGSGRAGQGCVRLVLALDDALLQAHQALQYRLHLGPRGGVLLEAVRDERVVLLRTGEWQRAEGSETE
jgi:hypothetical protein